MDELSKRKAIRLKFLRKQLGDLGEEDIRRAEAIYVEYLELLLRLFERTESTGTDLTKLER